MAAQAMSALSRIPETVDSLDLTVLGATVVIRHEERADIALEANNPGNWTIEKGSVRQTKEQVPAGGGLVIEGSLVGSVIRTRRNVTVRVSRVVGGISMVDGKKVTGSEESGDQRQSGEPDKLEILVPLGFRGALAVTIDGGSVEIDRWSGSSVRLDTTGDGNISIGDITDAGPCTFKSSGDGDISLKRVNAASVSIQLADDGSLKADSVVADTFVSMQTGDGGVKIGSLEAIQLVDCQVDDDGQFCVTTVKTRRFNARQSADGDIRIGLLEAPGSVECRLTDDGSFTATGVKTGFFHFEQFGDGSIAVDNLEAESGVDGIIDKGGLTVKQLTAGTFMLKKRGDGDVKIESLCVSGSVYLSVLDDGAVTLGNVNSRAFSSVHQGDGGLEIEELKTGVLEVENSDDADIRIGGGSAASGLVLNYGDGNIRLSAGFSAVHTRNNGDGQIRIRG